MKKIFFLLAICLSAVSCELSSASKPGRTEENLRYTTSFFASFSAEIPAQVMDNCMLVQDFIDADESQRKSARFASIGYYASSNTFKIGSWGTFVTDGNDLSSIGTVWIAEVNNVKYYVNCVADDQWDISAIYDNDYYGWKDMTFKSTFTFLGRDIDNLCIWQCVTSGSYSESDRYSATFGSDDELDFNWISTTQTGDAISLRLVMSGVVTSVTFVDGVKTDWCTLTYEKGEIKKTETQSI